jgi:hypothetical protein
MDAMGMEILLMQYFNPEIIRDYFQTPISLSRVVKFHPYG